MENAEYVNLKLKLSFIDVQEMNELGGDHVSLSTCYIPDATEQILYYIWVWCSTLSHWVNSIFIFTTGSNTATLYTKYKFNIINFLENGSL